MSTPLRHLALLVASAALVAAACGDDEAVPTIPPTTGATTSAPAPTTAPTTTPGATSVAPPGSTTTATTTTAAPPTTEAGPRSIEIVVAGGVVDGPGTLEVDLGTTVAIVVTADVADEVHLHGYDVFAVVGPSSAAVIEFVADVPGRFEMELEDSRTLLLEIEVS